MADTLETLLNDIQMGYTTNLIPMLDNLSPEKIIEQLGPGGYDELFNAALDSGNAGMVKLLLRRSNLITIPLESVVSDELSETGKKAYNVSPDVKKELQNFIRSVNRSNLQDYKGKPKEWKKELEEARKNGYNDLADRLENRMKFEENRRLENDGKRPEGTSENRWFMDENAWVMDGFGRMEFDMYGQKNAQAIMDELQANGIRVDDYSAYIKNEKTGDLNDYRIYVNKDDVEKLKKLLKEKQDLYVIAGKGATEEESSNDTHEEVAFVDQVVEDKVEQVKKPEVKKMPLWMSTGTMPRFDENVQVENEVPEKEIENEPEQSVVDDKVTGPIPPKTNPFTKKIVSEEQSTEELKTETPKQGEEEMAKNRENINDDVIFADPDLEGVEASASPDFQPAQAEPQAAAINVLPKNKTTFRDLNKLDAHMSPGEVLARLEDVELPQKDNGQKALLDEIKKQYQQKRSNADYVVRGLNGRINSTDMLRFAQHIDNIIDDGEPDNIDYTQGRDVMIRSLENLDAHLQLGEVLARLEDVRAKTQNSDESALLDLVREEYEKKRINPKYKIGALNDLVEDTAGVNLAERIDLAIDDGEIENVNRHINDVIAVEEPKAKEKDIVPPQPERKLGMNKFQRIDIDPDTLPPVRKQKVDDDLPPATGEEHPEEEPIRTEMTPPTEEDEMTPPDSDDRSDIDVDLPKRMDPTPGIKGNWELGPSKAFIMTAIAKDSFKPTIRPYYFNPKDLSPEDQKLAWRMLTERGIKPVKQQAPADMEKSHNPVQMGEIVWVVGAEHDENGKEIPYRERSNQIKQLKTFWKACMRNKKMAYGLDLKQPTSSGKGTVDDDLPPVVGKDGKGAKRDWDEGARGEAVKFAKEQIKDVALSAVDAFDKFGERFAAASGSPEQLGSEMLCAMLVLPWDFVASYLKRKAERVDLSVPAAGKKKDSFMKGDNDAKLRQAKAMQEFMKKMMEKDPSVFADMAEKGILGPDVPKGEFEERLRNAKGIFAQDPQLFGRVKACFGQTAAENPELFMQMIPADYKGPVTPEALLNHVMGWGNDGAPQQQAQTVVQPQPGQEMSDMQALLQEIRAMRQEVQSLRSELASVKAELAQARQENAQLRAERDALLAEKAQKVVSPENTGADRPPVPPTSQVAQPKTETQDVPDLEAVIRPNFMNMLNRSMTHEILNDELKGYADAQQKKPEELQPDSREAFLNAVGKAYASGKVDGLNDLIKSDKELAWANEIAHAVEVGGEYGNGDNFPRVKKDLIITGAEKDNKTPTPSHEPADNVPPTDDVRKTVEEAVKNPPQTPEEGNDRVQQVITIVIKGGKFSQQDVEKLQAKAQELAEKTAKIQEKQKGLNGAQEKLLAKKEKEIKEAFELNNEGKVVLKGTTEEVSAKTIQEKLGKAREVTKTNVQAVLNTLSEKGEKVVETDGQHKQEPKLNKDEKKILDYYASALRNVYYDQEKSTFYFKSDTAKRKDMAFDELKKTRLSGKDYLGHQDGPEVSKEKLVDLYKKIEGTRHADKLHGKNEGEVWRGETSKQPIPVQLVGKKER